MDAVVFVAGWTIAVVLVYLVLKGFVRAVRIVPVATEEVIERWGRYHRTIGSGVTMIVPFVDKVRARVECRFKDLTRSDEPLVTADGFVMRVERVFSVRVVDARAAVYGSSDPIGDAERVTLAALRDFAGSLDREEALAAFAVGHCEWVRSRADAATKAWGVRVHRVVATPDEPLAVHGENHCACCSRR